MIDEKIKAQLRASFDNTLYATWKAFVRQNEDDMAKKENEDEPNSQNVQEDHKSCDSEVF